ncbi:hypothetical protein MLD38_011070 [Melastoma candidum]|uniref:Uncharacterized protein n=1 Tax=Melastoma candidum TaxID=119954 RepID=A0ACB9R612_9MYRT|nr:hypothetical protein MLD38_011070 [Melastoma candidum]
MCCLRLPRRLLLRSLRCPEDPRPRGLLRRLRLGPQRPRDPVLVTAAAAKDDSKANADPPPQGTPPTPTSAPSPPMEESALNTTPNATSYPGPITFSIWPPSQRTRDAVIARLVDTLSTPSVLSKRYGTLPQDEASESAHAIEEEAFNAAGGASTAASHRGASAY